MAGGVGYHTGKAGWRLLPIGTLRRRPRIRTFLRAEGSPDREIPVQPDCGYRFFRDLPGVNRCAVGEMETGGHLDGPEGLIRCHRPHGHHQRCRKRTGWSAAFVGSIKMPKVKRRPDPQSIRLTKAGFVVKINFLCRACNFRWI